jgi:hypothetical protein
MSLLAPCTFRLGRKAGATWQRCRRSHGRLICYKAHRAAIGVQYNPWRRSVTPRRFEPCAKRSESLHLEEYCLGPPVRRCLTGPGRISLAQLTATARTFDVSRCSLAKRGPGVCGFRSGRGARLDMELLQVQHVGQHVLVLPASSRPCRIHPGIGADHPYFALWMWQIGRGEPARSPHV